MHVSCRLLDYPDQSDEETRIIQALQDRWFSWPETGCSSADNTNLSDAAGRKTSDGLNSKTPLMMRFVLGNKKGESCASGSRKHSANSSRLCRKRSTFILMCEGCFLAERQSSCRPTEFSWCENKTLFGWQQSSKVGSSQRSLFPCCCVGHGRRWSGFVPESLQGFFSVWWNTVKSACSEEFYLFSGVVSFLIGWFVRFFWASQILVPTKNVTNFYKILYFLSSSISPKINRNSIHHVFVITQESVAKSSTTSVF